MLPRTRTGEIGANLRSATRGGFIDGGDFKRGAPRFPPFRDLDRPRAGVATLHGYRPNRHAAQRARFDGKVIGALRNGEIVRVLQMGADPKGKPWAYVAYETNGEGWVHREFISCY